MEKNNYAYIAIVAIVAVVALVVLMSGNGITKKVTPNLNFESSDSGNLGGQAIRGDTRDKCIDSDGGFEPLVYGEVTYESETYEDYCFTDNAQQDAWCTNNFFAGWRAEYCNCENGVCTGPSNIDFSCTDTDGGPDRFVKGSVKYIDPAIGIQREIIDYCIDDIMVLEAYCFTVEGIYGPVPTGGQSGFPCPRGTTCEDGACKRSSASD